MPCAHMRVRTKAGLINSQRGCGEYQRIAGGIASSKPHRLKNRKSAFSHFRNLDAPKREVRFGLSTDIASVVWQLTSANWRSSRVIYRYAQPPSTFLDGNAYSAHDCGRSFGSKPRRAIMIRNGIYSLIALAIDGVDVEVGGVLILLDGKMYGGDSYVYYEGSYECSAGKWKGEMISREHTPTNRPTVERVQHIKFSGTYDDASVEADATVLVGNQHIRYTATLRLLHGA